MSKMIVRAAIALAALAGAFTPAMAQDDAQLAASVSPQIAGIDTGGSWSANNQSGFYRSVVVMVGSGQNVTTHLYLQWLAADDKTPVPTVVKTVPVKEVNAKNLPNAAVNIGGEEDKDNQAVLVVSSFDFKTNKETDFFVTATTPGNYTVSSKPPKGFGGPPPGAGGPGGPGGPAPGKR